MSILLYIYFSLQNISTFIGIITIFAIIPYGVFTMFVLDEDKCKEQHKTVSKIYLFFIGFSIFLASIPDIKQMSMIFGIPAAMELSKNPDVQKIPQNILNIINQELEEKVKKNEDKKEGK